MAAGCCFLAVFPLIGVGAVISERFIKLSGLFLLLCGICIIAIPSIGIVYMCADTNYTPIGKPVNVDVHLDNVGSNSAQCVFVADGSVLTANYFGPVIPNNSLANPMATVQKSQNDLGEIKYDITKLEISKNYFNRNH